eukprot:6201874-Pleurochrysis_carterae.AAC.2
MNRVRYCLAMRTSSLSGSARGARARCAIASRASAFGSLMEYLCCSADSCCSLRSDSPRTIALPGTPMPPLRSPCALWPLLPSRG